MNFACNLANIRPQRSMVAFKVKTEKGAQLKIEAKRVATGEKEGPFHPAVAD